MTLFITKASGEKELFSEEKIKQSLTRSGASRELADSIVKRIRRGLRNGVPSYVVLTKALRLLKEQSPYLAARYNLKRAIMELGPTGFPFERYFGELLKARGYSVTLDQMVAGQCVHHEVDVIAEKNREHYLIEIKYHNTPGIKTDVKVALYVRARFEDILKRLRAEEQQGSPMSHLYHGVWLVTNTKCTRDAIQYGGCAGVKIIGWSYPHNESLQNMIEELKLYPITCLLTLSQNSKRAFLERGIVLAKDFCRNPKLLEETEHDPIFRGKILEEVRALCGDA